MFGIKWSDSIIINNGLNYKFIYGGWNRYNIIKNFIFRRNTYNWEFLIIRNNSIGWLLY